MIWERETEYQYARVIEHTDGGRRLELNEGHAVHSVYRRGEWLTGGYWDEMLALPLAAENRRKRVAILGNAAGTTARAMATTSRAPTSTRSRSTPTRRRSAATCSTSRTEHEHPRRRRETVARGADATYDVILVDAYRQPYIPFYLTTQEFFDAGAGTPRPRWHGRHQRRPPGGVAEAREGAVRHAAGSFGRDQVFRDPGEHTTRCCGHDFTGDPAGQLRARAPGRGQDRAPRDRRQDCDRAARRTVYTDDRPVEWLVDGSLAEVAE